MGLFILAIFWRSVNINYGSVLCCTCAKVPFCSKFIVQPSCFFLFTHWIGFGGLQRCWISKIPWGFQFQQATTGVDPQQTWTEIQTCIQPGKQRWNNNVGKLAPKFTLDHRTRGNSQHDDSKKRVRNQWFIMLTKLIIINNFLKLYSWPWENYLGTWH